MNEEDKKNFKILSVIIVLALVISAIVGSFEVVSPGYRGVRITMGSTSPNFVKDGLNFKFPLITTIKEISIRQETKETLAPCFSSDMQQVNTKLKVLYSIPEDQVVNLFKQYQGDVFESLIAPRVQEALKEVTAISTAEQIVKNREKVKVAALESTRHKVGSIVVINDIVIENIDLTAELEKAIEAKMVQEQLAGQSKFKQDQAKIEAETKIIEARASAEAIKIQGEALKATPDLIQLKIVEKWDGKTPMVVGGANGNATSILIPMPENKK